MRKAPKLTRVGTHLRFLVANVHSLPHLSTLPAGGFPEATQAHTELGPTRPPASPFRFSQIVPVERIHQILRKQFKKKDTLVELTLRRVNVLSSLCFSN